MKEYNHKIIEAKWQKIWEENNAFEAKKAPDKEKFYALIEFPYPSGDGLHVGHIRSNTAMDIIARKRRKEGYEVLYPIGWDAFGLPTENHAIKTGRLPQEITKENTDTFRRQLKSLGFSFEWSREINTTDPAYYKWTQWIFLKLYEHGLAYKKKMPINWCLDCKIGLANEEVVDGVCERCGGDVELREKEQWMLKITQYAERLYDDLEEVDYLEPIKAGQRNWIGKSEGAEIKFEIKNHETGIKVFTTRPDTLFGATYVVLAPEHEQLGELIEYAENKAELKDYIVAAKQKKDIERTAEGRDKTGVKLEGVKAINPATHEEVPIFVADYVLAHYGTGAIMAVPAHDERDFEFAQKYDLPILQVICGNYPEPVCPVLDEAYTGEGNLVSSGEFDGMTSEEAKEKITERVGGKKVTTFKLRDWVFSRQRYWGEPIPIIHCQKCGMVPVPEEELPVVLPEVSNYKPTDEGNSPLASATEWVNVSCPQCGGSGKRETDTMPNWAGSSWYYLRYTDPHNDQKLASDEALSYWTPVDWYNGGMEHTTLHLLYSRFWHKFLYDINVVPTNEPYQKRTAHGLILAEGGQKMSKSKGNVINPDDVVAQLGADTLRVYEMFMGPFDEAISWSTDNIVGSRRFLEKVWRLCERVDKDAQMSSELETQLHQTIRKVGDDIEEMRFNTAISSLMILTNMLEKEETPSKQAYETLLVLLAPFAPHITEELWEMCGNKTSAHEEAWPSYDESKIHESTVTLAVQINGKVRDEVTVEAGISEDEAKRKAVESAGAKKWLEGNEPKKIIYVENRLVNIVV